MRYTVHLDCKNYVSRDGTLPVLLRYSVNGVHDYLNTGRRIKAEHYDPVSKTIRPGIKGHSNITSFIDRQKVKVSEIIDEFEKRGEVATLAKVKDLYEKKTGKVKSDSFYEYVEDQIRWERSNSAITSGTLDNYEMEIKKLRTYRPKLTIHDIDKSFLQQYRAYVLGTLGHAQNTAYHAMVFLRKYTKRLFDEGKIHPYPFTNYTVGSPFEVDPAYLEPEELTALHNLYDSKKLLTIVRKARSKYTRYREFSIGEKYQEVLRYFLVACYTGLRHSDIKTLSRENIKGKFIVKEMQKGREGRKKTVRIPIRKRLFSLLDMHKSGSAIFNSSIMAGEQTNKYLKAIMGAAGIKKHITFHYARHSFAIISLILGIKIEVVSDILGHSELTTTQRYARVVDSLRDQEMDKWDKMGNEQFTSANTEEIICPKCDNIAMKFEKGIIVLNSISISCPFCSTSFLHQIKHSHCM